MIATKRHVPKSTCNELFNNYMPFVLQATRDRLTQKRQEKKMMMMKSNSNNDDSDSDDIPLSLFKPKLKMNGKSFFLLVVFPVGVLCNISLIIIHIYVQ